METLTESKTLMNGISYSVLATEQSWLKSCIENRIAAFKNEQSKELDVFALNPPPIVENTSDEYALLIKKHKFNNEERLLLALAMCNHFDPRTLNGFMETP